MTAILRANSEDGNIRRRDVASFALLLIAPAAIVAGASEGPVAVQQAMALAAALALVASLRLTVKASGVARVVCILGVATAALTFAGGVSASLNGGILTFEPACTALLIAAVSLFIARLKTNPSTGVSEPLPSLA
ncbi:hypothetical protein [Arthrobacter sp. UYCo732]|uniref:hypothetical protein n=1 Tax=Arthrobacter sp. UYCo732 TaxID=3156336 RepID=UPI0033966039